MQKNIEIDIASYVFSWQLFLAMYLKIETIGFFEHFTTH